jgi:hypothetical protein
MARPTTKAELLAAAATQWDKLWGLIDALGDERTAEFTFDVSADKEAHWRRDKNVRDVLVHLYEWHQLLLSWLAANTSGGNQPFLPAPYTWKTYGDLNVALWQQHQATSSAEAEALLRESHAGVLAAIDRFSDEELFEKRHFPWTGTTNLGSYCVSATSSHYDWAIKNLRRHAKQSQV